MDIVKLETIYKAKGFETLVQNLLDYEAQNDLTQQGAEKLANSFFDITAGGGDCFGSSAGILFKRLHDKFPKSKMLSDCFKDIYNELENNGNIDSIIKFQSRFLRNNFEIMRTQTYKKETILEKINIVIRNTINSYNKDYNDAWEKIYIDVRCMNIGIHITTYFIKKNESFKIKGNIDTFDLMNEIKYEMYEQAKHEGAWFFCKIEVLPSLKYIISFNYDNMNELPDEKLKSVDNFQNFLAVKISLQNGGKTYWVERQNI
jgi:hypothetical protein